MNSMVAFSNPLTSSGEMKPSQVVFLSFFYFYCKLESKYSGLD